MSTGCRAHTEARRVLEMQEACWTWGRCWWPYPFRVGGRLSIEPPATTINHVSPRRKPLGLVRKPPCPERFETNGGIPNAFLIGGDVIPAAPWRLVPQESAPPHMRKAFGTPMNNFGTFPRFPTRRFPDVSDWVSNNPWPLSMTSESRPWLSIGVSIPKLS